MLSLNRTGGVVGILRNSAGIVMWGEEKLAQAPLLLNPSVSFVSSRSDRGRRGGRESDEAIAEVL